MPDFIPRQDGELVDWSKNLCQQLAEMRETLQLTEEEIDSLRSAQLEYASAYRRSTSPELKSPVAVTHKTDTRKILEKKIRLIWKRVVGLNDPDNALRARLGMKPLTVKRRAIPPPVEKPGVRILDLTGNTVSIKLYDRLVPERRGKPRDVQLAQIFYHHGPTPPNDIAEWIYAGAATDVLYEFAINQRLTPGDQIWVTAKWCNHRQTTSPPSDPVRTFVQFTEFNLAVRSDRVDDQASTPLLEAA